MKLLLLALTLPLTAQEKITYEDDIFPLFEQSCLNCHNPDKKKGDLDLSSYPALMVGGSGGKVAIPGDGGSSKLYTVTTGSEEPVMPPKGDRIEKNAADLIRAWIDGGMLETKDSSARKTPKPKFDLAVDTSAAKPEGPPPMPQALSLDPAFVAPRSGLVKAMSASPWAPLIAFTAQKQILLYHSETFRFLGSLPFPKGQPESLSFHPSGKYLLASGGIAGKSGLSTTWDITTGKEVFSAGREFDSVLATAITPDLKAVAMGGPSRLLKIWDTNENKQTASVKKHTDWITALAASPNGKFFASGDRNGGIHVWDIYGNEIHSLRDHQGSITALAFRSDSKLLASTSEDGQLMIWDMKKGSAAKKIKAHNKGATALHYHRDGHLITAGRDRIVKVFQPDFKEKTSFKNLPEVITAVARSQNGKHIFMADFTGEVFVYDVSSNKAPLTTLESNPPTLANRLAFLQKRLTEESQQITKYEAAVIQHKKQATALATRIAGTQNALQKNQQALQQLEKPNNADELNKQPQGELRGLIKAGQESLKALKNKQTALKKKEAAPTKALAQARQSEKSFQEELAYWKAAERRLQSSRTPQ